MFFIMGAKGQTDIAFKSGEQLNYNLYFNWQFVWIKVGYAAMSTTSTNYKGSPAYKCSLSTTTNKRADKFFLMRDTLTCYVNNSLQPLYYRKAAHEGKRNYVDVFTYSYQGGKTKITSNVLHNDKTRTVKNLTSAKQVYDMLSIFLKARNYDATGWKKGHTIPFAFVDGGNLKNAKLVFRGKTKVKADNDIKYECLELSYIEQDDGKDKEIVRFFVTNDKRHIPIRLDLNLKFGSAKAFLKTMKGV